MKFSKPIIITGSVLTVCVAALGVFVYLNQPKKRSNHMPRMADSTLSKSAKTATLDRTKLDGLYGPHPKEAEQGYRQFIAQNEKSKDPHVQDEVGIARFRVGYLVAARKDFKQARAVFLEASANYKGSGAIKNDFGGIKDGADYQAAVCLVAEGKKDEAKQAFTDFLKHEPQSPLAKAAFRRLVLLNGGKDTKTYDDLLQSALTAQQKNEQYEMTTCGPRTLEYLLPTLGRPRLSYKELASICGTGKNGTSMEQMRDALKHFGIQSYGYILNRKDFAKLPAPALMLSRGHYTVVQRLRPDEYDYFDPISPNTNKTQPLPDITDANFSAEVLTLKPMFVDASDPEGETLTPQPVAPKGAHEKYPRIPKQGDDGISGNSAAGRGGPIATPSSFARSSLPWFPLRSVRSLGLPLADGPAKSADLAPSHIGGTKSQPVNISQSSSIENRKSKIENSPKVSHA